DWRARALFICMDHISLKGRPCAQWTLPWVLNVGHIIVDDIVLNGVSAAVNLAMEKLTSHRLKCDNQVMDISPARAPLSNPKYWTKRSRVVRLHNVAAIYR